MELLYAVADTLALTVISVYQITTDQPAQCSVSLNQTSTSAPPVLPTECASVTLPALTVRSVRLTTTHQPLNAIRSVTPLQITLANLLWKSSPQNPLVMITSALTLEPVSLTIPISSRHARYANMH